MKLNIETTTKVIAEHKSQLLTKLGQGISLGKLVTMGLRDIIASQASGAIVPQREKRGANGLT